MKIDINGSALPVDDRFVPVCTFDSNGRPVPLGSSGGGIPAGFSTEAKQNAQLDQGATRFHSEMGLYGSDFIADTAVHTGVYYGFIAISDASISAITLGANSSGGSALAGVSLLAGQQILAHFTSITLASGTVQLIKAPTPFPAP